MLARPVGRRRPLSWVKQCRRQRNVYLHVLVFLEQPALSVYVLRYFNGNPPAACGNVVVKTNVGTSLCRSLNQAHEQEAILLDPELLRRRIAGERTDDENRFPAPNAVVKLREVESIVAQLRQTRRGLEASVAAGGSGVTRSR